MHRRRVRTLTALGVGVGISMGACSQRTSVDARAIDVAAAAPAGPRPACPVFTTKGECRAVAPGDVVTLASGGLVLPAGWFPTNGGGSLAFGVRWGTEQLLSVKSERAFDFGRALDLPFEGASGATGVTVSGAAALGALYFLGRTPSGLRLQVARVDNGVVGTAVPVTLDGYGGAPTWPQAVGLPDGRTLLAFVEPQRSVFLGVDDGAGGPFHVEEVDLHEPSFSGVLAHVGVTTAGTWVVSYQVADTAWHFRSRVMTSADSGRSWSAPIPLPSGNDETLGHAFPLARIDRGADIYYVRGVPGEESVRRRALHEDGTLGEEQLVTSGDVGRSRNPQARRLHDGRVALMFTVDQGRTAGDLSLVMLDGDAPL